MKSVWFTAVITLFFTIFLRSHHCFGKKGAFLRQKFGDAFMEWAAATPVILPKFKNWRPPSLPFSFKLAINREYYKFSPSSPPLPSWKCWLVCSISANCF